MSKDSSLKGLKQQISAPGILKVPGVFDAFSAKIAEYAGFSALCMGGSASSSALLGKPDVGLMTLIEMVENAHRIADAVDIPLIADADTGYGNAINVMRTVREFESAGAAAILLEDQQAPKKCGHMERKRLISAEEMVGKVEAALEARRSTDFVIIARTDARAALGLEEAIRRGRLYKEAGADVVFGEALQSRLELKKFAEQVEGPLLTDSTEWGASPLLTSQELEDLGYDVVIFSTAALRVVHRSVLELMKEIHQTGTQQSFMDRMEHRNSTYALLGYPQLSELEDRFLGREAG